MSDLQSRAYRPNPKKCCEACVFGRGQHAAWCRDSWESRIDAWDAKDGHFPLPWWVCAVCLMRRPCPCERLKVPNPSAAYDLSHGILPRASKCRKPGCYEYRTEHDSGYCEVHHMEAIAEEAQELALLESALHAYGNKS